MRVLSQEGAPPARRRGPARPQARRLLAALGADRAGPPRPARGRRAHRHARARDPGAVAAAGLLRRRAGPGLLDHAQGLRPARQGLRRGLQRHVPDRRRRRRTARRTCRRSSSSPTRSATTDGLASVSPPVPSPNGKVALIEARPATAPQDAATSQLIDTLRDDVVPQAVGRAARLRRRDHRDLRRLRRRADRQAAAVHRRDRPARLPAADDRLPQPADPADRGGDEPARRGRRVRRRHARLPGRVPRRAARGRDRADRGVPAGDDAGDPVRALDGLPGVPRQPHARGVGATPRTTATPCGSARPRPAA